MNEIIALIIGATGQDGAHLFQLLLKKGYVVHGVKRRSSSFNTARVDNLYVDPNEHDTHFFMLYGDLTDSTNLIRLIQKTKPNEIYNLATQSHVAVSFETPEYTSQRRCHRYVAPVGSDPHPWYDGAGLLLPGLELAQLVTAVVRFKGDIVCDTSEPDGTPRKLMSANKIKPSDGNRRPDLPRACVAPMSGS